MTSTARRGHELSHTGERPFACTVCAYVVTPRCTTLMESGVAMMCRALHPSASKGRCRPRPVFKLPPNRRSPPFLAPPPFLCSYRSRQKCTLTAHEIRHVQRGEATMGKDGVLVATRPRGTKRRCGTRWAQAFCGQPLLLVFCLSFAFVFL